MLRFLAQVVILLTEIYVGPLVVMENAQINQSISKNLYSAPSRYLLRGAPDPGQAEKSLDGGGIENRYRLGDALDLLKEFNMYSKF